MATALSALRQRVTSALWSGASSGCSTPTSCPRTSLRAVPLPTISRTSEPRRARRRSRSARSSESQRALGDSGGAIGARVIADAEHLTAAPVEDEETLERVVDVVHAEVELDAFTRSGAGALDEGTAVLAEREAADGQRRGAGDEPASGEVMRAASISAFFRRPGCA